MPWKLVPNKIVRYPGGREIDRFRGIFPGADDGRPEAWVGSGHALWTPAEKGTRTTDALKSCCPTVAAALPFRGGGGRPGGGARRGAYRPQRRASACFVKLLDAEKQLGLQTHPTRAYAKEWFGSDYGKEESWYVIGKREDSP